MSAREHRRDRRPSPSTSPTGCAARINRRHGTTYYWSSLVLPRLVRHHVWALYAFCRYADDIVDDLGDEPVEAREKALTAYGDRFFADLDAGRSDHPVLRAVVHTVRAYGHDPEVFRRFLASMAMDLAIDRYATWDDLLEYMDGLGGGHRRDDAADPRAARPGGRARPGPRPRLRLPAHELPPRRGRGPRPRAGLPARSRTSQRFAADPVPAHASTPSGGR